MGNHLNALMASTRAPTAGEWDTRTRCAVPVPGKEAGRGSASRPDYLPVQFKLTPPRESATMLPDTVFRVLQIAFMSSSHLVMRNTYLANASRMVRSVLRTSSH